MIKIPLLNKAGPHKLEEICSQVCVCVCVCVCSQFDLQINYTLYVCKLHICI